MDAGHYIAEYDLAPPTEAIVANLAPSRAIAEAGALLQVARR
jgi:hypothetical protein